MESIVLLLAFSAFLVIVIYKMDVNEKKAKTDEKNLYEAGFIDGIRHGIGMNWGISREEAQQKFSLRKKDK